MVIQNFVTLYRNEYPSYYKYRKAIKAHREWGYFIARCYGGVICFLHAEDCENWRKQK